MQYSYNTSLECHECGQLCNIAFHDIDQVVLFCPFCGETIDASWKSRNTNTTEDDEMYFKSDED